MNKSVLIAAVIAIFVSVSVAEGGINIKIKIPKSLNDLDPTYETRRLAEAAEAAAKAKADIDAKAAADAAAAQAKAQLDAAAAQIAEQAAAAAKAAADAVAAQIAEQAAAAFAKAQADAAAAQIAEQAAAVAKAAIDDAAARIAAGLAKLKTDARIAWEKAQRDAKNTRENAQRDAKNTRENAQRDAKNTREKVQIFLAANRMNCVKCHGSQFDAEDAENLLADIVIVKDGSNEQEGREGSSGGVDSDGWKNICEYFETAWARLWGEKTRAERDEQRAIEKEDREEQERQAKIAQAKLEYAKRNPPTPVSATPTPTPTPVSITPTPVSTPDPICPPPARIVIDLNNLNYQYRDLSRPFIGRAYESNVQMTPIVFDFKNSRVYPRLKIAAGYSATFNLNGTEIDIVYGLPNGLNYNGSDVSWSRSANAQNVIFIPIPSLSGVSLVPVPYVVSLSLGTTSTSLCVGPGGTMPILGIDFMLALQYCYANDLIPKTK